MKPAPTLQLDRESVRAEDKLGWIEKMVFGVLFTVLFAMIATIGWGRIQIRKEDITRGQVIMAVDLPARSETPACIISALKIGQQGRDRSPDWLSHDPPRWRKFNSMRHIWIDVTETGRTASVKIYSRDDKPLRKSEQARVQACFA